MHRLRHVLAVLTVVLFILTPARAERIPANERLADELIRSARLVLQSEQLVVEAIDIAEVLVREAAAVAPDDLDVWRMALELSLLGERSELRAEALRHITRLDPADDSARLMVLTDAMQRYQTVEERVVAYERLLAEGNREKLGEAIASRLAFDMAGMLRRHGDMEGFAEALAESVAIDPSNRIAAATAAGFFRVNVDDPYAEAELLITVLLADPTEVATQAALGRLLIEHGAPRGARRMYQLAVETLEASGRVATNDLLADLAIAQWATGDVDTALRTIAQRQQLASERLRMQRWNEEPELDPLERAAIVAPLSPTLATVRAAIHVQEGHSNAEQSIDLAIESYESRIEALRETEEPNTATIAALQLELAWVRAWLDDDPEAVRSLITEAEQFDPISESARARFDGVLALRQGETQRAIEILEQLEPLGAPGGLGLAMAYERSGRTKDAARAYLAVAREQPGSLIGVWSANALAELLGRRVPLSDDARRLEQLIDTVPSYIDRYPSTPSLALDLRIVPRQTAFEPYEPIMVDLEVRNNSPHPLAIDRDGPIMPHVLLQFDTTFSRRNVPRDIPPAVVEIDRRLRLEPRETLVIPIDLRQHELGHRLLRVPQSGAFVRVKATLNPMFQPQRTGGIFLPGPLGTSEWTQSLRINGEPLNEQWISETTLRLEEDDPQPYLTRMPIVASVLSKRFPEGMPQDLIELLGRSGAALETAYGRMDPEAQAWLPAVLPGDRMPAFVRRLSRISDERLVRVVYLLFHTTGEADPVLQAALDADDDSLRTLAEANVTARELLRRVRLGSLADAQQR
jgi:tetratricopeptide (TPR) repeat protein